MDLAVQGYSWCSVVWYRTLEVEMRFEPLLTPYLISQKEVDVLFLPFGSLSQGHEQKWFLQRLSRVEDEAVALFVGQELVRDSNHHHLYVRIVLFIDIVFLVRYFYHLHLNVHTVFFTDIVLYCQIFLSPPPK